MNINKRLKPNLVDPIVVQKIVRTLNPPKQDYWEPTKNVMHSFYTNYIKTNFGLIIVIIIICIFLVYRYRVIKSKRENEPITKKQINCQQQQNCQSQQNFQPLDNCPQQQNCQSQQNCQLQQNSDPNIEEYKKLLVTLYNKQKEDLREPPIKNFNKRMIPAQAPRLAYPMYAYVPGGSLAPSGSR